MYEYNITLSIFGAHNDGNNVDTNQTDKQCILHIIHCHVNSVIISSFFAPNESTLRTEYFIM